MSNTDIDWNTVSRYKSTLEGGNVTLEQLNTFFDQMNIYRTSPAYTSILNQFNQSLGEYIATGGLTASASVKRQEALEIYNKLANFQTVYVLINQKLVERAKDSFTQSSSGASSIGELQGDINALKSDIKTLKADLDTAKSRQTSIVESSNTFSYHQGFASSIGFKRPFRKASIAILLASGIFLIFLVGLIFYDTFKSYGPSGDSDTGFLTNIIDYLTYNISSKSVAISLGLALVLFIAILTPLAYYGYLGKK